MMDTAALHSGLRWLPLAGWPRPACPPLPARADEIAALVGEAGEPSTDPLGGTAHALNKAALLASDCGLDDLARDLCWRHIDSYRQASRPLTAGLARRMLGPAPNLARLQLRPGEPDSALQLLETIHHAVTAGGDLTIDGQVLPVAGLAGSPEEHARLRNIVRQHHLTDGIRAHVTAGRWDQAARLAEELGGVREQEPSPLSGWITRPSEANPVPGKTLLTVVVLPAGRRVAGSALPAQLSRRRRTGRSVPPRAGRVPGRMRRRFRQDGSGAARPARRRGCGRCPWRRARRRPGWPLRRWRR